MATNHYFNKFNSKAEQRLVQDLVDEAIKIHGVDMIYIPRSIINKMKFLVKIVNPSLKMVVV